MCVPLTNNVIITNNNWDSSIGVGKSMGKYICLGNRSIKRRRGTESCFQVIGNKDRDSSQGNPMFSVPHWDCVNQEEPEE